MSIRHSGRDCPAACQFVFKCASQSTPVTVPRHVLDVWENIQSNDADHRPEWQNPTPVFAPVLEQWRFKSPYRAQYDGPNFWSSHGDRKGRYGFSKGGERGEKRTQVPAKGIGEATHRSQQSEESALMTMTSSELLPESESCAVNRSHASSFDSRLDSHKTVCSSNPQESLKVWKHDWETLGTWKPYETSLYHSNSFI